MPGHCLDLSYLGCTLLVPLSHLPREVHSMSTKTVAAAGAAVLLITAGVIVAQQNKRDEEPAVTSRPAPSVGPGRHNVQLIVGYDSRPEHVIYTVAGADTTLTRDQLAPNGWTHQLAYIPGAFYAVSAYQKVPGALRCSTSVDGILVDSSIRHDAGSVRCYVNRPN